MIHLIFSPLRSLLSHPTQNRTFSIHLTCENQKLTVNPLHRHTFPCAMHTHRRNSFRVIAAPQARARSFSSVRGGGSQCRNSVCTKGTRCLCPHRLSSNKWGVGVASCSSVPSKLGSMNYRKWFTGGVLRDAVIKVPSLRFETPYRLVCRKTFSLLPIKNR